MTQGAQKHSADSKCTSFRRPASSSSITLRKRSAVSFWSPGCSVAPCLIHCHTCAGNAKAEQPVGRRQGS